MTNRGPVDVDHQMPASGGRFHVLLADSGRSLVVAELKVVQSGGTPLRGLHCSGYVAHDVEPFTRLPSGAGQRA